MFTHYCSYVNESRLRLIVNVNENSVDLETALIRARHYLWEDDLPNFRKFVPMLQVVGNFRCGPVDSGCLDPRCFRQVRAEDEDHS